MLNHSLVEQLKKLNNISDKVVMRYPITTMVSDAGDIMCNLRVDAFDSDSFDEFGIFELGKMINTFNLFGDRYEVQNNPDSIVIKSGQNTVVLKKTDLFLLANNTKDAAVVESTKTSPNVATVAEFTLTVDEVSKMKKAISIFGSLDGIRFDAEDGQTHMYLTQINRFANTGDSYDVEFLNSSSKNFGVTITKENFLKLPTTDYRVQIKYNEKLDAYRVLFLTDNYDIMVAVLAE